MVGPRSVDEELMAKHLNMQDGQGWNMLDCYSMLRFQILQLQNSKGLAVYFFQAISNCRIDMGLIHPQLQS